MSEDRDWIRTECPGCGADILLFDDGEAIEPRDEPAEGLRPTLDIAFKPHDCPASLSDDDRPLVMHAVVEANRTSADEADLYASVTGPYADETTAEREASERREAIRKANTDARESDDRPHYEEWTVETVELHVRRRELVDAEAMDAERYRTMKEAASAVMRGVLDDGGGED